MTSTYDHRVIQGAESGAFLRRIDQLLQGEDGFYDSVFGAMGVEAPAEAPTVTAAEPVPAATAPAAAPVADAALLQAVQAATSLVKAHRMHGHLAARLDPLGSEPVGDPALEPATVGLDDELMRRIPASVLRVAVPGDTFADALPQLRKTYTGTIAYEIEHISDHQQRMWLRQAHRVGHLPAADELGGPLQAARAAVRGGGARELPPQGLPGQEAVLDRGPRRARADAGRVDRARRGGRGARGGARHGTPRPAERAGPHGRPPVRRDPRRVRGRADDRRRDGRAGGRHRRREVPLRRQRHVLHALGPERHRHAVTQPEPPRVREPGDRGPRARRPDDAQGARDRRTTRPRSCRS